MFSHLNDEVRMVEPLEIQQAFVSLSDEISDLQVVERFFEALEQRYLKNPGEPFDSSKLRANVRILESFAGEIHREKFAHLVNEIKEGVRLWVTELQERDSNLETYHLRRFCDDPARRPEPIVFSALTRFYRTVGGSESSQSKFDLSITRLFSKTDEAPYRAMLIERGDLEEQIDALFEGWDNGTPARRSSAHASLVVAKLDDFRREAEALAEYNQLLKSDIFERLRAFKRKLGDLYFEPAIAAAAVECNITIGNAFNRLLSSSSGRIAEKLSDGEDLGGVVYDASPQAESRLKEILSELRTTGDSTYDGDAVGVDELLELVSEGTDPRLQVESRSGMRSETDLEYKSVPDPKPQAKTAQKRLEPLFFTLSQPEPSHSMLRDHIRQYPSIDLIDLRDFIGRPEDPTDHLCRNVLGIILWVEELCEHELKQKGEISGPLKEELHRLLRKSEEFSEQLDYLIRENSSASRNRLLIVSNKLLEARLKLKRGIARFTRSNLTPEPARLEKPLAPEQEAVQKERRRFFTISNGHTNRWLVAATLLVSIVCGAIYFADQQMEAVVPVPRDVELLDVKRLPKGEHFQQAYRKNDLVFITAKSSWAEMSEQDQRENLEEIRKYPSKAKINTVMITDGMGRVLGDVSREGTRILGKLQIADNAPKVESQDKSNGSEGERNSEGSADSGS